MKKVLKIITKQEFTSLYRFGFLPKDPNRIIVEDESSDSFEDLYIERLMQLPYFSGDEEYITIGFAEPKEEKGSIEIEEVLEVIPFTEAARVSYQHKFDSRIAFQPARFEDLITEAELMIDVEGKIRGAEALWRILNTDELTKQYVKKEDVEFSLRARRSGQKSTEFQNSFDAHLLTYVRYEFFPNTDLGYFYDVGEVYAHSIGKPTFKGSALYNFLESIKEGKRETQLSKLIDFIEKSEEISAFKTKCMKGNLKQYLVGVLFLMFKDELADKESIYETEIKKKVDYILNNKPYKEELRYALYITGIFFGYSKFYSDLYDEIGLAIFKEGSKKKTRIKDPKSEKSIASSEVKEREDLNKVNQETKEVVDAVKSDLREEVKKKINALLEDQPDHCLEVKLDVYKQIKDILEPLIEVNKPKQQDYFDIIKKEFNKEFQLKGKSLKKINNSSQLSIGV